MIALLYNISAKKNGKPRTAKEKTKMLRLTENQLATLRNVREISFRKLRSFTDYSLASGIEEIDLTYVPNNRAKALLIEFFEHQRNAKRGDRTITRSIYRQTRNGKYNGVCIVEYVAKHGFGYAWSQDLENEFVSWVIRTYNVKHTSKTYKALVGRCLFSF